MQPHTVGKYNYRIPMKEDPKRVLWQNVLALMHREFGKVNVTQFAAWAKIGVGSVLRMREQQTSVGLDIVEKIAKKAGVEPWMLLVPGLDTGNPPMLAKDAEGIRVLVSNINKSQEALSGLLRVGGNTEQGGLDELPPNVRALPDPHPPRPKSSGIAGLKGASAPRRLPARAPKREKGD